MSAGAATDRSVFSKNRMLWIGGAAGAVLLTAGLLVGRFALPAGSSPDSAPEPGLVTVPVAFGPLSNDVTIRGEMAFADEVEVTIDTSAISGPPVVTGQVPTVGAELAPLSVALEIAGRPTLVLPGELPAYRTLRFGVTGPDVVQFKEAMRQVGLDAGDPANNVFDETAAHAITSLYAQAGYPVPDPAEGAEDSVRVGRDGVRDAELALTLAQSDLAQAVSGPSPVAVREADIAVSSAQRELDTARATSPQDAQQIAGLEEALGLAQLQREQLGAVDASAERGAEESAVAALEQARDASARADQDALPYLPAGEVLYLTDLPRRVDSVAIERGATLSGTAMKVSGASLSLSGTAAQGEAKLLEVGDEAFFETPDGMEHSAVVSALTPGSQGEVRWTVVLTPAELPPEQVQQLQRANVRVRIPVGATKGDVLSVPAAALSAGPGGETRVEVVDGDPQAKDTEVRLVNVETGLATAGAVEITPIDGGLDKGDLVVVGR